MSQHLVDNTQDPITVKKTKTPSTTRAKGLHHALDAYQEASLELLDTSSAVTNYFAQNKRVLLQCHAIDHAQSCLLDAYLALEPLLDVDKNPHAYCEQVSELLDVVATRFAKSLDYDRVAFVLGILDAQEAITQDPIDKKQEDTQVIDMTPSPLRAWGDAFAQEAQEGW